MYFSDWLVGLRSSAPRLRGRKNSLRCSGFSHLRTLEPRILLTGPTELQDAIPMMPPDPAEGIGLDAGAAASTFRASGAMPTDFPPVNNNAVWTPVGPGPIEDGQVEGMPTQNNPVSGAVHAVVAHPTDANILWLGATNGGLWKTTNATAANPTWTPLIDQTSSLSIGALALDPTDATNNTLVAGIGRYSSLGRDGGTRSGLLRSTNGGATWTTITGGGVSLLGKNISGIAARGNDLIVSVNVADAFTTSNVGIFRSTNGGSTFTQISGASGSGLPLGVTYDLAADPLNNDVLYTSVVFASGGPNGFYKSIDRGATWTKVSSPAIDALLTGSTSNVEMSVGRANNVFAGIVNQGQLAGLFMSPDGGINWTQLDTPVTNEGGTNVGINPRPKGPGTGSPPESIAGGQGAIHFSIVADPVTPTIVYVGGDRQPNPFPNSSGAVNFSGRLFRVDGALAAGSQATSLTHNPSTNSNSSPHADSRDMTFDAAGNLIEGDDGGIYRRTNPRTTGDWFGLHGNLQNTEFHSIAYDSRANIFFGGTQDVGTPVQTSTGSSTWEDILQGDGGVIAVDTRTLASLNQSIRYVSFQNFGAFSRLVYNASNQLVSFSSPTLTVTQTGTSLFTADTSIQFYQPYELNAIDPARGIIGTNNLYESNNQFNTLDRIVTGTTSISTMAYGGTGNADVIYYGDFGGGLFVRQAAGGAFSALTGYQGGTPRDIIVDPDDWQTVIVIDSAGVYRSTNAGTTWTTLTGDLGSLSPGRLRTVTYVEGNGDDGILVGGDRGVFLMELSAPGVWDNFGPNLPNAPVSDLRYDATDDVLVAGLMGRGAWAISSASQEVGVDSNFLPIIADQTFSINENSGLGSAVGTVVASDPDGGQTLTYAITAGNTGNAFSINAQTGALTVATPSVLDAETISQFLLTVQVTDNGSPALSSSALMTVDITNVNESPQTAPQAFDLQEFQPAGTSVGTVTASDPDVGQTFSYAITSGNINNAFAINAVTGEITVSNAAEIDRTKNQFFQLAVQVTDNGTPALSSTAQVTISIIPTNRPPILLEQTFRVFEAAAAGTVVGDIFATDPDSGQTLTYALLGGNMNNAFSLNTQTGRLTVNNPAAVDFETQPVFTLQVEVTDDGSPVLSRTANMTVEVIDLPDQPIIQPQSFNVAENRPVNYIVGTVQASHTDAGRTLSYAITNGNQGGIFAINASTGQLTIAKSTLNFETTPEITLTVTVTDDASPVVSRSASITITVLDLNEAPTLAPATFNITENRPIGYVIGGIQAFDQDLGQSLTYSIVAGDPNGVFAINAATGVLTVAKAQLNFEVQQQYQLTVAVTDSGTPAQSRSAPVTINILNLNEPPVVLPQTFVVSENRPVGTVVGQVVASDPDAGQSLSFAILNGNPGGLFSINAQGQLLVTQSTLNFEAQSVYNLEIGVSDNGNPMQSRSAPVTVQVRDLNEAPTIAPKTFTIPEQLPQGALVGTVTAFDQDFNQTLRFAIIEGNTNNAFAINAMTGLITVANPQALVFETTPQFQLTVTVTDNGVPVQARGAVMIVNLVKVNHPPVVNPATFGVVENSATGTFIGAVTGTPSDPGQTLKFAITGGNVSNAFAIDMNTGRITVANPSALNFETAQSFILTISATDNGTPPLTASAQVTVNVLNANDAPVVVNQNFTATENIATGTVLGTVVASDPDAGQTLKFEIAGGNPNSAFAIDQNTGVIRVSNAAMFDFETNPQLGFQVKVTDSGSPALSSMANVVFQLTNQNDPPVIANQTLSVNRNAPNGTTIGTVVASEPDVGQSLKFEIVGGNVGTPFGINQMTGVLFVANRNAFLLRPSIAITVKVTDNGPNALSATGVVTVNLTVGPNPVTTPAKPAAIAAVATPASQTVATSASATAWNFKLKDASAPAATAPEQGPTLLTRVVVTRSSATEDEA